MNEHLKECPFCGGKASLSQGKKGSMFHHYVECLECEAMSAFSENTVKKRDTTSEIQAAYMWNRRHKKEVENE